MLDDPIVQVAYFVSDAEKAAHAAAERFGTGPFFLLRGIELSEGEVAGRPQTFIHSSAYGQWGQLMMDFVQQDEEGPSPFRMMYKAGEEGLHHVAMMVDSLPETYAECERLHLPIATRAVTLSGIEFSFIDIVKEMGHMIEIYEKSEELSDFYRMIREAAIDWNGRDPVRPLG